MIKLEIFDTKASKTLAYLEMPDGFVPRVGDSIELPYLDSMLQVKKVIWDFTDRNKPNEARVVIWVKNVVF